LDRRGSNHLLLLDDGSEIPVARLRRAVVEDWLDGKTA
jgi:hypothetical protein